MSVPFKGKTSVAALVSKLAGEETPLSAMIEIADRCNEKCVHCYQVQGQKGEMTTEEIFGVLDELAEMGVLFLTISGGEATLRKDFLDIVAYARKKKFAVKLFTLPGDSCEEALFLYVLELFRLKKMGQCLIHKFQICNKISSK